MSHGLTIIHTTQQIAFYENYENAMREYLQRQDEYNQNVARKIEQYRKKIRQTQNPNLIKSMEKPPCIFCKNSVGMKFYIGRDKSYIMECGNTENPCYIRKIKKAGDYLPILDTRAEIMSKKSEIMSEMRLIQGDVIQRGEFTRAENVKYEKLREKFAEIEAREKNIMIFQGLMNYKLRERENLYNDLLSKIRAIETQLSSMDLNEKTETQLKKLFEEKEELLNQLRLLWIGNHYTSQLSNNIGETVNIIADDSIMNNSEFDIINNKKIINNSNAGIAINHIVFNERILNTDMRMLIPSKISRKLNDEIMEEIKD